MPQTPETTWQIKEFDNLSPHELYAILNLRGEVFAMEQGIHYLDTDGKDQQALHLFATVPQNSNEPIGIIAYARLFSTEQGFTTNSIGRVCVEKNHRGQGLAKELMLRSLAYFTKKGQSPVKIVAQNYLVDFYRSLGFRTTSEVYTHNSVPHIDMVWTPEQA